MVYLKLIKIQNYMLWEILWNSLLLKHVLVNLANVANIYNNQDIYKSKLDDLDGFK